MLRDELNLSEQNEDLIIASMEGNVDSIKVLINSGTSVNYEDEDGFTPLIEAVLSSKLEAIEILLKLGANINGSGDMSPLGIAAANGILDSLELLIKYGAQVNPEDDYSILRWAIEEKELASISTLLSNGAIISDFKELYDFLHEYDNREWETKDSDKLDELTHVLNVYTVFSNQCKDASFFDVSMISLKTIKYQYQESVFQGMNQNTHIPKDVSNIVTEYIGLFSIKRKLVLDEKESEMDLTLKKKY